MTPLVIAAVLFAAVTHASWNAIAHGIKDQLLAFTLICTGGGVCGLALLAVAPLPDAAALPYLIASAIIHIGYMTLLMASFRLGDFGQSYPIARGSAPLLVTVFAAVFVGERLDGWQIAGVAVASAGLMGVAVWGFWGTGRRPHWPAILAALGTGATIAAYTVVDGVGVRASDSAAGYTGALLAMQGVVIPAYALATRRRELLVELRPVAWRGLLGGVLSVSAYGLVLWAQTQAELAPIAALRESSIIVGAAIGAVFFKEGFGAPRIAAAGLMVVGIGLMLHAG
ncbi:EamA family transporter [Streptomyces boninensis]|uniref:EamA family transporter n=1 Tax=Streptomyces boninensis TaxID=2039455 RepID=UPI003B21A95F